MKYTLFFVAMLMIHNVSFTSDAKKTEEELREMQKELQKIKKCMQAQSACLYACIGKLSKNEYTCLNKCTDMMRECGGENSWDIS